MKPIRPQAPLRPRDRDAIIRSLRSGVVPATGLQHIQVGRLGEVQSFLRDIDTVADGGASLRLVVGEYGSGKTFFLTLVKNLAMERGLVTMQADLSPEKRLHDTSGRARRLLSELVASLSTRTKRDGNALAPILERLSALEPDRRRAALAPVRELPGGHAFATAVEAWLDAPADDDGRRAAALRWLSAGFATRTDANRALGLRDTLGADGGDIFGALRLFAALTRAAGYKGLYVVLDELVNLYKIVNAPARRANYEEILSILNNTLQGNIAGLGVVMAGTPELLTDTRRGLYSYEALRSRLAENSLSGATGLHDYNSTVLRLPALTPEELYVLLRNLRAVYAAGRDDLMQRVPDKALQAYLTHCLERIGESYFRTPRNTIKGFLDLLSLLEQYPDRDWAGLLPTVTLAVDTPPSGPLATDLTALSL